MKDKRMSQVLFSVCGPSGSGKTTLVRALAAKYCIYLEGAERNPHLHELLHLEKSFDAYSNQHWFVSQIATALHFADSTKPLILDQDPAAIVRVYGKLFLDQKMMTDADYSNLDQLLIKVEGSLRLWRQPRRLIMLSASPYTLKQRVHKRGEKSMPIEFYEDIVSRFQEFSEQFPSVFHVTTDNRNSDSVSKCVLDYIMQTLAEAKAEHK